MINVFNEIVEHDGQNDFRMKLNKMGIASIFQCLYEQYCDGEDEKDNGEDLVRRIIQYIALCYSMESTMISTTGEWKREKQKIYQHVKLPISTPDDIKLSQDIIYLESPVIVEAIQNWLKYKDSDQLSYLKTLQDLYIQQQRAAISDIVIKGTEQVNYDQKQRCAVHMRDLKEMIKDAKSALEQNSDVLKDKVDQLNRHAKPRKETLGVEQFV